MMGERWSGRTHRLYWGWAMIFENMRSWDGFGWLPQQAYKDVKINIEFIFSTSEFSLLVQSSTTVPGSWEN